MGRVEESRGEVRRERPGGEGWDQQSEKGEEGKRGLANVRRIDAANHDRFLNLEQREEREERERKERQETNPLLNETAESPKRRRRRSVPSHSNEVCAAVGRWPRSRETSNETRILRQRFRKTVLTEISQSISCSVVMAHYQLIAILPSVEVVDSLPNFPISHSDGVRSPSFCIPFQLLPHFPVEHNSSCSWDSTKDRDIGKGHEEVERRARTRNRDRRRKR